MPSKHGKEESSRDSTKEDTKGREKSRLRGSTMATGLSVVSVVLSVIAVIVAFAVPGPRSTVAQHSVGGQSPIGATCTHYPGAEVSISVPGAGTVVVSATVGVGVNHISGISDTAIIVVATSATECTVNDYTAFISVPSSIPTDPYPLSTHFTTVPLLRPFLVEGPATLTFYVNGVMAVGADDGDRFDSASLVAVHYPR